jgi:hypothetical protein
MLIRKKAIGFLSHLEMVFHIYNTQWILLSQQATQVTADLIHIVLQETTSGLEQE